MRITPLAYAPLVAQLDARAFPAVPEDLSRARAALDAAQHAMQQVNLFAPLRPAALHIDGETFARESSAGAVAYAEALARRLAAGEPLPADLVDQSYAAVVFDAKAAAADTVTRLLEVETAKAFDEVAAASVPALLDGLQRQLAELMTRTRAHAATLAPYDVTQPGTLVTAPDKVRRAYVELGEIAELYARMRTAQRATETAADQAHYGLYERLGLTHVEDALELWPDWREAELDRQTALPWPADPRAHLLLIATREPWVPTLAQMAALRAAAATRPAVAA